MREHLVLTILIQVKDMYNNFVHENRILNAPVMDETILDYDWTSSYVDSRFLRDDNLYDAFIDLVNTYKKYYIMYKESTR